MEIKVSLTDTKIMIIEWKGWSHRKHWDTRIS